MKKIVGIGLGILALYAVLNYPVETGDGTRTAIEWLGMKIGTPLGTFAGNVISSLLPGS